jgi:methylglutaconyl-CoA hydratase
MSLQIFDHGPIREIRLDRPGVHNALDPELIAALREAFRTVEVDAAAGELRCVLLSGSGKSFCAGADLEYMRSIAGFGQAENVADAETISAMLCAIRFSPVFVVARVHGAALGGGSGLLAACDFVIASSEAVFGFTEVRLGILPAVISPFVIERIGPAHARALFPTGLRFDAAEALRIGLVDLVVAPAALEREVARVLESVLASAPGAATQAKALIDRVASQLPLRPGGQLFHDTAAWIARLRAAAEGQEGMSAFFEKRPAAWVRALPDSLARSEEA